MVDELQTAVLFTANIIESKNIIFLIPQKIIIGECNDDTTYFFSYLDNKEYQNADDAVRENNYISFYYNKTIGDLKSKYETDNLEELCEKYFEDLFDKVYYYDLNDENNFENYFMKSCSIEEFNNKFDLNFSYNISSEIEEEPEKELDPVTKNFKYIKDVLDKNILFQNEAKNQLINILYDNAVLGEAKSNIIISGPSGVGKSEMLKLIEEVSTQPVLYTKFNPNLVENAKDYLDSLLLQSYYIGLSKEDKIVSHTIIIDDFDNDFNYLVASEVIDEITKFKQEGKRFVRYAKDSRNGLIFNPKYTTFIICGNFNKVSREKSVPINFFSDDSINYDDLPLTPNKEQLQTNYGFSEESLDYFCDFIDFKPLSLDKTKKIMMYSNKSLFKIYCKKLKEQGILVDISDETIDLICKKVYSKFSNIKNINNVISNVFKDIMVSSLNLDENSEIIIDNDIINDYTKYTLKKGFKK